MVWYVLDAMQNMQGLHFLQTPVYYHETGYVKLKKEKKRLRLRSS